MPFGPVLTNEIGHQKADSIFTNTNNTIIFSSFCVPEVTSALTTLRNQSELSRRKYKNALAYFFSLIKNNTKVMLAPIKDYHISNTYDLITKYSLRPGDALQLSTALDYKPLNVIMVTGDGKIFKGANGEGLQYININECICTKCGQVFHFTHKKKICPKCKHWKDFIFKAECLSCGNFCTSCTNTKICLKLHESQSFKLHEFKDNLLYIWKSFQKSIWFLKN